jgi:outer membrane protein OmpA-like peptidoglycan-associated protein
MSIRRATFWVSLVCLVMAANALPFAGRAAAQQPGATDIANTLAPKSPTRGLAAPSDPNAAANQQFLDGMRGRATRSITIEETNKLADIAKDKPSIDLEVNFDYDSASIGDKAADALAALGTALRDPRLKGALVLLAGHTDGKGSDAYNKELSDRRAEAVRQFLAAKFSLPAENLIAIGFGKSRLKNTADPFAAENRRVQVVNMSAQ